MYLQGKGMIALMIITNDSKITSPGAYISGF